MQTSQEELATLFKATKKWIQDGETIVSVSKLERKYELCIANRNACTFFIIKQSRGYVEKYPRYAPAARYLPKVLL
jgi:hypothetical protein